MAPGDYERKGAGGNEGECAGCGRYVQPNDQSVIRYSTDGKPGGIFHLRCDPMHVEGSGGWYSIPAPTGPQWYGLEGDNG